MATVTITTDTVSLWSHEVYLVLTLEDASAATYDCRLLELGKLKYEFDIPNSGTDVTAVGLKAGSLDISIENFFTGSTDELMSTLISSYDYSVQTWSAKMYLRQKGGTYGNPLFFSFAQSEVDFDEETQVVSISLLPKEEIGYNNGDFVELVESEVSSYVFDYNVAGENDDAILAGEYISQYLFQNYIESPTYPMGTDEPIVISNIFIDGNPSTGNEWFISYRNVIDSPSSTALYNNKSADYVVGLLASLEGAIYGSSLGKPFYVARKDTTNTVTLDYDDITKLKQVPFFDSAYRNCFMTFTDDTATAEAEVASRNPLAEKDINISFGYAQLNLASIDSASACTEITADDSIILEGIDNYALAFSFDRTKKLKIRYWGIDSIYPYSVINFDGDAPSDYQSRNFRIKSIEYDLTLDAVEMEVYEI